jgi:hypothetical protein
MKKTYIIKKFIYIYRVYVLGALGSQQLEKALVGVSRSNHIHPILSVWNQNERRTVQP